MGGFHRATDRVQSWTIQINHFRDEIKREKVRRRGKEFFSLRLKPRHEHAIAAVRRRISGVWEREYYNKTTQQQKL